MAMSTPARADARFEALRKTADPAVAAAIERAVAEAPDGQLFRVNVIAWAAVHRLSEDLALDAFIRASTLGLFEMSWSMLCPGCGGVLNSGPSLVDVKAAYECRLCAGAYEPKLDEMVEVSFTVSPGVRRIAHHTPDSLPYWDFYRHVAYGNAIVIPSGDQWLEEHSRYVIEVDALPARQRVILSIQLPSEFTIVFEPVLHSAVFVDIQGDPTRERQELALVYDESGVTPSRVTMRPGPCNQTFRDKYRAGTLTTDQRLKITSLTVLFTDLKGSTALYERVGDLAAYDIVKAHFGVMAEVVRRRSGAVVKTIGDAVMATFDSPDDGFAAALDMRRAMDELNARRDHEDLQVKVGLHEGPCLAVTLNDRLDYFGQTVNIAARVQGLAESRAIYATEPIVTDAEVARRLSDEHLEAVPRRALLKGIKDELTVYEIP